MKFELLFAMTLAFPVNLFTAVTGGKEITSPVEKVVVGNSKKRTIFSYLGKVFRSKINAELESNPAKANALDNAAPLSSGWELTSDPKVSLQHTIAGS